MLDRVHGDVAAAADEEVAVARHGVAEDGVGVAAREQDAIGEIAGEVGADLLGRVGEHDAPAEALDAVAADGGGGGGGGAVGEGDADTGGGGLG